jgi:short-subunit dehydrogenase
MAETFWNSKCAIVTGASSGIGRALSIDLARRGARVGLVARRDDKLAEVTREILANGGKADHCPADVTEFASVSTSVRELERSLGECDVAIACAGIYRSTNVDDLDPQTIQDVVTTNVLGVSNLFAAVTHGMIRRGRGHLAAVSSIAGYLGLPGSAAYSASKAAVNTFLQSLRLHLAPRGIRVTTVCPGYVDTPMITEEERRTLKGLISAEEAARRIARAIETGKAEVAFPWGLWLQARCGGLLPWQIYRLMMGSVAPMVEAENETTP